jgi:hypothetical protein
MLVISGGEGTALLDAWVTWAWHGPRPPYVKPARSIRDHQAGIDATSPGTVQRPRVESMIT